MLRSLLFAVFLTTFVAASKNKRTSILLRRPVGNATGVYNIYSEKCCLGKISAHNSREDKCCGDDVYNPTKEICCNGTKSPLVYGNACCGSTLYNTVYQVCCENQIINVAYGADSPYIECCGKNTYDMRKQSCCYDGEQVKVVESKKPNSGCCGKSAYDYETEVCCSDYQFVNFTLYPKQNEYSTCCGQQVIDGNKQGCCNDTAYNLDEKACCYDTIPFELMAITKKGQQCCGKAKTAYDPFSQQCCGDKVIENDNQKQICCYSVNGTSVVEKEQPDQNGCCGMKPFNYYDQECCTDNQENNEVYSPANASCCGGKVYSGIGICCPDTYPYEQQIFQKTDNPKKYACCGSQAYNVLTQLCCGNTVINSTSNNLVCCGNETLDSRTHVCCSDYDYSTGTGSYSVLEIQENKYCCGTKLVDYTENTTCCGNQMYNVKKQVCCSDKIFDKKSDTDSCCFEEITDENPTCWIDPLLREDKRK